MSLTLEGSSYRLEDVEGDGKERGKETRSSFNPVKVAAVWDRLLLGVLGRSRRRCWKRR
jgi:hypothetical protein